MWQLGGRGSFVIPVKKIETRLSENIELFPAAEICHPFWGACGEDHRVRRLKCTCSTYGGDSPEGESSRKS